MAPVATSGLIVNLGGAVPVHRAEGESLNMRASFLHLATEGCPRTSWSPANPQCATRSV